jgi:hypothetical protein
MHTVELLDHAQRLAELLGFRVRQEWLGGSGGGVCEFAGQRWIFVDLAQSTVEQLDQVLQAVSEDPAVAIVPVHPALRRLLKQRAAA